MQKHFFILLIFFTGISFFSNSQTNIKREKYWLIGANFGVMGWSPSSIQTTSSSYFKRIANYGIDKLTDPSGNQNFVIIANTSIGAHTGFVYKDKKTENRTGIYFEFQKNKACYSFKEPFSYPYKGDTATVWAETDNYLKYSVGIMRTWNFHKVQPYNNKFWYAKISFGQTFYHRNFKVAQDVNYQEDWTDQGTGMKSKVLEANKKSLMISTEIGKKFLLKNNATLDFGIVYHAPFANTRIVEYEFFKSNVSLGKSQITYFGSTIMLNVNYTLNYKIKSKPIDSTKINSYDDLAVDSSEIKHHEKLFHHHKINGRKFHVQQSLTVINDLITISIWDKNKVDGDEISLYLNEKPIVENYTVTKTKKIIEIKLQPGTNIIVMHALNLGKVPPNTAALNINDGTTKKNITLVSDLHKSGALEIIYNP